MSEGGVHGPGSGGDPQQASAPAGWYRVPDGRSMWWSGSTWHEEAPLTPTQPYEPVAGLAIAARVAVGIVSLGFVIGAGVDLARRTTVGQYQALVDPTGAVEATPRAVTLLSRLRDLDDLAATLGLVRTLLLVVAAALVAIWQHRVQTNLRGPLRVRTLEFTPAWAAGWWFVPVANLVMPRRTLGEAWTASSPDAPPAAIRWTEPRPWVLDAWWGCWVVGALLGFIDLDGSAALFRTQMLLSAASQLAFTGAGICFIVLVGQISQRQARRAGRLGLIPA